MNRSCVAAAGRLPDQTLEGKGIAGSIARLIIIEVDINRAKFAPPLADARRPVAKGGIGIVAPIGASRAVQPEVGELGRQLDARTESGDLEYAKGCAMAAE